ncbi:hypothetical protein SVIO_028660 [Streptomyces violaceusniger]|uniref:Uncharacterized protein n=1 Tax=Streptomyces violaceusniger TaxID=68280 RepID=A0A4D4L2K3_STRVO|nr:hypothetical protein SVIO_028660 [Streptomyces violaceusniger]
MRVPGHSRASVLEHRDGAIPCPGTAKEGRELASWPHLVVVLEVEVSLLRFRSRPWAISAAGIKNFSRYHPYDAVSAPTRRLKWSSVRTFSASHAWTMPLAAT